MLLLLKRLVDLTLRHNARFLNSDENNTSFVLLTDVDECSTPANNCKFACKNLIGSFACICPEGYAQIGTDECRDINECADNSNACRNGFCVNLSGTYRCDCYDGFKPSYDGKQCIGNALNLYVKWHSTDVTSFPIKYVKSYNCVPLDILRFRKSRSALLSFLSAMIC